MLSQEEGGSCRQLGLCKRVGVVPMNGAQLCRWDVCVWCRWTVHMRECVCVSACLQGLQMHVCVHIVIKMCVCTRVCACKYVVKVCGVCVSDG